MIALGITIGLLIATFIAVVLTYFRRPIEQKTTIIEKAIGNAGPRPKGFIIEPPSEAEDARARIIAENKEKGLDTRVQDLE